MGVYIFSTVDNKYQKIGITNDVRKRLGSIQNGCPFDLYIYYHLDTPEERDAYCTFGNIKILESYIHRKYEEKRIRGEWFSLSESELLEAKLLIETRYKETKSSFPQEVPVLSPEKYEFELTLNVSPPAKRVRIKKDSAYHKELRTKRKEKITEREDIHGTYSGYVNYACRCDLCREANNEQNRKVAARRKTPKREPWQHGSLTGYSNHKCRCSLCKQASKQASRDYYIRKKTSLSAQP